MDGGAAVQGTDGQSDKKSCILCGHTECESLCKDCYVPWLPEWTQTMNLPPYLLRDSQLHSRGQFVCLQCVSEEEYGLSARQQLSEEQAEQLDAIELRAEQLGGFPGVEIVEASTIRLVMPESEHAHVSEPDNESGTHMSLDSSISSRVSAIAEDPPLWMASEVLCRIQLATMGGQVKELQYRFDKGQNHMSIGNLVAQITKALEISRIGQFKYFLGVAEIQFTDAMVYASLREWLYEKDPHHGAVLTLTIQCVC